MVYDGAEYSSEDLFRELKRQVEEENVRSFDQYRELIDNLIEEKRSYGFFTDEEDLVQMKHSLELRWNEIQNKINSKP